MGITEQHGILMRKRVVEIKDLFDRVAAAHHDFERDFLRGVRDETWESWYALAAIKGGLGNLVPVLDMQTQAFLGSWLHYRTKQMPEGASWAKFIAEEIVNDYRLDILSSIV